jgi:hypothetical protein
MGEDGQIKRYEEGTLKKWAGSGDVTEKRKKAADDIIEHLQHPTPSLAITNKEIHKFDDDFYAMIANDTLRKLNLSGNKLGVGRQSLAGLSLSPNLEHVDLRRNEFGRVPEGLEDKPPMSRVDLRENPLSTFARIDAKLLDFANLSGLQKLVGVRLRVQNGPTIMTDSIWSDSGSLASFEWPSSVLDDIVSQSASIQEVEEELEQLRNDATSSQADKLDLDKYERRWREVGDVFARQAYVSALESVITNQGGPFKSGRMQKYHQSAELGATIACNRSLTLHQLPGQPDLMSDTAPGLKAAKYATKTAGLVGKFMPGIGGGVEGAAQLVEVGIDVESARRLNAFHDKLLKVFSPAELPMLVRVLSLAMTLTMGEQLESQASVHAGKLRHNDPAQKVIDWLQKAVIKDTSTAEEKRAFHDVAYLMADIASGAAYGVSGEAALRAKLQGWTFEQKVEAALRYWASGKNTAEEQLPFKSRYVLCDSPLLKQMEIIAKNYTLNDLEQGKRIRKLEGQLASEITKRHEVKRSSRATTPSLINLGIALDPPSPWESETEEDKDWWEVTTRQAAAL